MKRVSIYDNDLNKFIVENKSTISAYRFFLRYVCEESLGEWWLDNKEIAPIFNKIIQCVSDDEFDKLYNSLFSLWIDEVVTTEVGKDFIKNEIEAYNFEIKFDN